MNQKHTFADAKSERWLSVVEIRAQTRFQQFRPYHVTRNGKNRMGSYDMRHCSQSVRDFEAIEEFFHAQRMKARGFHRGYMGRCTGHARLVAALSSEAIELRRAAGAALGSRRAA